MARRGRARGGDRDEGGDGDRGGDGDEGGDEDGGGDGNGARRGRRRTGAATASIDRSGRNRGGRMKFFEVLYI